MKNLSKNSFVKTALVKASFFSTLLISLLLSSTLFTACGLGPDPDADGARFNRRYYYYYVQDCKAGSFGAYDCGPIRALSPSMRVGIRIDSDGFATLTIDNDRFYFLESSYDEDYELGYGSYYSFYGVYQDDDELTLYESGQIMAHWYWDNLDEVVTYYFYDLP